MFMIAVCLMTVVSCSREDSIDDENVLTRSRLLSCDAFLTV